MKLVIFDEPQRFAERVYDYLSPNEAANNLLFGLSATLVENPNRYGPDDPLFFAAVEESEIGAVALVTPPHNLVLSRILDLEYARFLAREINKVARLPGVGGPSEEARAFCDEWLAVTGVEAHLAMKQRIYQLEKVTQPAPVSGYLRDATPEDKPLLYRWIKGFQQDTDPSGAAAGRPEATVEGFFEATDRGAVIWEDEEPVSMAAYMGPTPNGIRVGAVYTPSELRMRGYASACVAALSQRLLDGGRKFCFLYTDLANPTSNHIYREIGYEPVCDVDLYRFG